MTTLFTADEIQEKLDRVAPRIVEELGPQFTMVPILTGGFVFAADLVRAIYRAGGDPEIDFIQMSSYGNERESSGHIQLVKSLSTTVEGQTVLIVDDVLDSGRSIAFAKQMMEERKAARVAICVAVNKITPHTDDVTADYALFDIEPDIFLVGYGMDDAGARRGLPDIISVD